jgi:hypothetical protein
MRIKVQSQSGEIVHKTLFRKKSLTQNRAGEVAQGVVLEFKSSYCNNNKKKKQQQQQSKIRNLISQIIYTSSDFKVHSHNTTTILSGYLGRVGEL